MKKTVRFSVIAAAVLCAVCILIGAAAPAQADSYAWSVTPKVNRAAVTYMTDMYIKNHPEMGKEICYGSPSDISAVKKAADSITAGAGSAGAKAEAIAKWVGRNIEYESMSQYQYPFDVLCARKSNCYGDANLMQQMMRLSGIPAVVCAGMRGDMKGTVRVSWLDTNAVSLPTGIVGHAWVYAWYQDAWHLFDPLFDVYDWTKSEEIDAWYCDALIEGVCPSYSGMDMKMLSSGVALYWVDGRPILYSEGKPYSQALNGVRDTEWGETSVQAYLGVNDYSFPAYCHSGFEYLKDNSSRKAKMVPDEVLSDGWIRYYGDSYPRYARANGTIVTQTMREAQGEWLYFSYDGTPLKCSLPIGDISLRYGRIELPVGSTLKLYPDTWSNMNQDDKYYFWSTDSATISVNAESGEIRGVKPGWGQAEAIQYTHEEDGLKPEERTHWGFAFVDVEVVSSRRTWSAKDVGEPKTAAEEETKAGQDEEKPGSVPKENSLTSLADAEVRIADSTYSGKAKKPEPKVILGGKTLKKGKDYKVSYRNNKKIGRAQAVITGTGNYTGTVTKAFSILPKKAAVSKLKAGRKKLTVKWKKVSGAGGYQLQYSTDKTFEQAETVTVRKAKATSYTIKKLQRKQTYYVRIRTWKKAGGKDYYSAWSKAKAKKVS